MDMWPTNTESKCLPPKPRVMPGRPKKKRQRAAHEPRVGSTGNRLRVTKHGVIMTCRVCGVPGHNAGTCTVEPQSKEPKVRKKAGRPKKDKPETSAAGEARRSPPHPTIGVNADGGAAGRGGRGGRSGRGGGRGGGAADRGGGAAGRGGGRGVNIRGGRGGAPGTHNGDDGVGRGGKLAKWFDCSSGTVKRAPSQRIAGQKLNKQVGGQGSTMELD